MPRALRHRRGREAARPLVKPEKIDVAREYCRIHFSQICIRWQEIFEKAPFWMLTAGTSSLITSAKLGSLFVESSPSGCGGKGEVERVFGTVRLL